MATPVDRLVRKEVALGTIRERPFPQDHIGLSIAPFMDVATDDVIFDYIKGGLQDGLAPARAEDAEAELSQKDELAYGMGRAAIIDWSLKDKYTASDVTRFRDALLIQQATQGINTQIPNNFVGSTVADFQSRLARHDALRMRKLQNRIEWMIMTAVETGGIAYNDGKIKFTVSYGRPANQQDQAPLVSGGATPGKKWDVDEDFDPINDIKAMQEFMLDTYGVEMRRALTSKKVLDAMWKSNRFLAAAGLPVIPGTTSNVPLDLSYLQPSWSQQAAINLVESATGVRFEVYDGKYRTRPIGSTTWTNQRFTSDKKIFFLPDAADLGEIDDTQIGFGKTLTAPHPEGNWSSGFYEWESEERDPWMHVRGNGVKAFPVFPYMEYTYTMSVLS
jgi:hypothetical protein